MAAVECGKINLSNLPVTNETKSGLALYLEGVEIPTRIDAGKTSAPVSGTVKSVFIHEIQHENPRVPIHDPVNNPGSKEPNVDENIRWYSTNTTVKVVYVGKDPHIALTNTESGSILSSLINP